MKTEDNISQTIIWVSNIGKLLTPYFVLKGKHHMSRHSKLFTCESILVMVLVLSLITVVGGFTGVRANVYWGIESGVGDC